MANATDPIAIMIEQLASRDKRVRDKGRAALDRLKRAGISEETGIRLLNAATQIEQCPELDVLADVQQELVAAVADNPHPAYFPVIERNIDSYRSDAKGYAIVILTEEPSGRGLDAFWRVTEPRVRQADFNWFYRTQSILSDRQDAAGLPFVELLSQHLPTWIWNSISTIVLCHLQKGWLDPARLSHNSAELIARGTCGLDNLLSRQEATGLAWMWADDYVDLRDEIAISLDLLGFVDTEDSRRILRKAASAHDPRLKYFALMSLMQLGDTPDQQALHDIARSAEMRGWLFTRLAEKDSQQLIPPEWRTQAALAESDMVQWLAHPAELGRVPDEIVSLGTLPLATIDGDHVLYVYRFRVHEPHWAAEDGWMVGWSGPYPVNGPAAFGGGYTFSKLETWDPDCPLKDQVDFESLKDVHS